MLTPLSIFIDLDGKSLVQSATDATAYTLPALVQGDTVQFEVTLLRRTSSYNAAFGAAAPFSTVTVAGLSLRVAIGNPTAATGSGTPTIFQNTFTLDTNTNKFTGELELGASACSTLLGSATSGTFTLEIEVAESAKYTTVFQGGITLKAELIEGAATNPPVPSTSYYTAPETDATFVKKFGAAGDGFYLVSPDGTKRAFVYLDDDGTLKASPIT